MATARVPTLDVNGLIESDKLPAAFIQETARDAVAAAFRTSGPISVTADDTANTITLTSTATANSSDAQLRDRATHTGQQTSATISDFQEAAQDAVAALLAAGTGVSLTYNDALNSLTVTNTGGGTGGTGTLDAEAARDAIGAAMIGLGVISVVYNDANDTITISSTATANSTDAALRDRGTHTGVQPTSSVSGLDAALSGRYTKAETDALVADRAAANHLHALADMTGLLTLAQIPNGTPFYIRWDATQNAGSGGWVYNGALITARPTTRTSTPMVAVGGTTAPTFAVINDIWMPEVV